MKTIMHKNFLDVAFEVHKLGKYKPGFYHLKGFWINLGYTGNPWRISDRETIVLAEEDYKTNWIDVSGKLNIARTKSGIPA
jgi:hypothetical protein